MKRVLLCAALLAWSAMASAVVYKWVDAQGKTQYGDRPPDGVKAELMPFLGNHTVRTTTAGTQPARSPQAAKATEVTKDDASTKKVVQQDVDAAREKQCTDAQARYKSLIEGRRIYKTGENGERQYMSAEEIDAERLNAKRDIDAVCNATS
jgi:hypothetical protein